MAQSKNLPPKGRAYIAFVCITGAVVLGLSIPSVVQSESADWLVLAGLALLTGSFTVKVPSVPARLSVSETFVFAAVLLYGPEVATVVVAIDTLVMSLRLNAGHRSAYRFLFNMAAGSVAIWCSSQIFLWLSGADGTHVSLELDRLFFPLAALALSYFLINSWLIAVALGFQREVSAFLVWRTSFVWLGLNYIVGASVASLLISYTRDVNLTTLGIIVPLLFITYLTFRTSMGRLEDANRHVDQLNELYLSAIETLAMAVDAKDQITHGHIRRVQVYAVELAKRVGVADERQLKAIEAAALLHDMGKLAIPEHILNKPGKLTSGEFEKMKRHSDIGADLLSSIPFPYPVVPIVRHHHENWDGTGYPNRIAGTDIPLGARILSVVDCFDALTSDRPYRPRLSTEAAFAILHERRGSMYDPLIVDTFTAAYQTIAPDALRAGQEARSLVPTNGNQGPERASAFDEIHAGSIEGAALLEVRRLLSRADTPASALSAVSSILRQYTPATVISFYEANAENDVLRCTHAVGDNRALLDGFEIPNGERATGWAAANQCSVMNSAAALDLGSLAEAFSPRLQATLCAPVRDGDNLVGVLTLYSTVAEPFNDRHRHMAEQVAAFLAQPMRSSSLAAHSVVSFPDAARGGLRSVVKRSAADS
jgi:putative nucleotidyltransferase with HDIG domain